jgi:hypothetical protein
VNLEGSLDAFSLPDVFQLLSLTKKSGGLHLTDGQVRGVVSFHEGAVTGATADAGRQSLARRLVGIGVVDDAALRRAVERAAHDRVGVARALVEAGAVDAETVRTLAAEQTVDAVFDLLRWVQGDFAFALDETNADDVGIALPADQVVAEATRRRQLWDSVSKVIPSPDVVLVMPVVLPADPTVSRDEWSLLALVDGSRTVGELVELSGAGQFSVVSALAGLVQRGMLAIKDEDAPDHVVLVLRRQVTLAALETSLLAPGAVTDTPAQTLTGELTSVAPSAPAAQAAAPASAAPVAAPSPAPAPDPTVAANSALDPQNGPVALAKAPAPDAAFDPTPARGAHRPESVVPERPEPFRRPRSPEHPDALPHRQSASAPPVAAPPLPPVTSSGATGGSVGSATVGSSAVAAAANPAIERDPSVNRSLLLKLIAGVKGL